MFDAAMTKLMIVGNEVAVPCVVVRDILEVLRHIPDGHDDRAEQRLGLHYNDCRLAATLWEWRIGERLSQQLDNNTDNNLCG